MFKPKLTITKLIITIILTLGISISFQSLLAAWTAPTVAPPGDNLGQPIDTSASIQTKDGDLGVLGNLSIDTNTLVVDSTNNRVGIGTNAPERRLQIGGNNARMALGETGYFVFNRDSGNSDQGIYFGETSDTGRYFFRSSGDLTIEGNVGIGTNAPGQRLHVDGAVQATGLHFVTDRGSHWETDGTLYRNGGQVYLTVDDNFYIRDAGNGNPFHFDTNSAHLTVNGGWAPAQALTINSNQIWKSQTAGDSSLYLQYSCEGCAVVIGDNAGSANNLTVHGDVTARDDVNATRYCDQNGNNCTAAASLGGTPAGAIMQFYLNTCPTGWKPADGTNGTPDLRGVFVRGMETFDAGSSYNNRDDDRAGAGTRGSYQDDEFESHNHTFGYANLLVGAGGASASHMPGGIHTMTVASSGGNETRPKNVALIFCQKE